MKLDTRIVTAGRDPEAYQGAVSPPVFHVSTVISASLAERERNYAARARRERSLLYGRRGNPTAVAFERALASLEGGHDALTYPSGLAAIASALLSYLSAGDHLLMTDAAYGPTRHLCDGTLARHGITTTFYPPTIGAGIAALIRPETRVVYVESPGSQTFEVQDVPAIAEAAHAHGAIVMMDNTWASPVFFRPFEHGVDVSIQAVTKYIGGHSDIMLGAVTTTEAAWPTLYDRSHELGQCAGPDDLFLAQRGLRTLAVRLARHQETGLALAEWLAGRPEVARVLHPGLPGDPGHALWRRDFRGASGLFSIVLEPCPEPAVAAMVDGLELFSIGASWGGYESLIVPCAPESLRTAVPWRGEGPVLRLHAGLEDAADLKADLVAGFARLERCR